MVISGAHKDPGCSEHNNIKTTSSGAECKDPIMLSYKRFDSDDCGPVSQNSLTMSAEDDDRSGPSSATSVSTTKDNSPAEVSEDCASISHEPIDNGVGADEKDKNQFTQQPTVDNPGKDQNAAFEEMTDLGLIFNILKHCLTQRQAAYGVISLALILNASDAFSDYTLAFYLYNTGFLYSALAILLIDYGVFFISLSHYLMSHLATASLSALVSTSLFLVLLHPFTPGLSALYWFVIRARGLKEDTAHYFLKMTSVIQGCAEAPSQIVATSWMILTHQLEVPWRKQSEVCDSWGNCIRMGALLSAGSLGLSWFSLLKASLESFQSPDVLSTLCLLLPSLIFRLASTILLVTYMEVRNKSK